MNLEQSALDEGFLHARVIPAAQVPFEPSFRVYCEENLCGQYGVNYSCPPACGSCENMRQRVFGKDKALVVQSIWDIPDYTNKEDVRQAKYMHNAAMLHLMEQMRMRDQSCIMAGASGCNLCTPCAMGKGEPCRFPDKRYSCLSAYCVFVKELADKCDMEYNCGPGKVAFFGMILFDEV